MGALAQLLGLENRGVHRDARDTGVHTIRLDHIGDNTHTPDKHRVKRWRGRCPAIDVETRNRRGRGPYRLVDGVSRVTSARQAGARTIRARVWIAP